MGLKDFHSNASDLSESEEDGDSIASSSYLQELNTLKIDKLSNRVTIISVMLPVLIGAVLFFIYLDIKDQVVDVDISKTNQVEHMIRKSEEKLNALDVRIAKNQFDLDEKLPQLEKKLASLETQMAQIIASKADVTTLDDSIARLDTALAKQDQRIRNNAAQNKTNVEQMERINGSLLTAVQETQEQVEKISRDMEKKISSLKESMDTRIVDLQTMQKNLSLLDKQIKDVEKQIMNRKEISQRFADLESALKKAISELQEKLRKPASSAGLLLDNQSKKQTTESSDTKADPLPDTAVPVTDSISEDNLTQ
ncbi:MAG: hypothetical protein ABR534_00215 [Desulfotignum sp.]